MAVEKLTIVGSLEPEKLYKEGDKFEDEWPLHVTLMPEFSLRGSLPAFEHAVGGAIQYFGPQEIVGGKEGLVGPDKNVRARLLGRVANLAGLHGVILANVKRQDGKFDMHNVDDDYVPYVAYQGERGLDKGEEARIKRLQLVRGTVNEEGRMEGSGVVIGDFPLLGKKRG